MKFDGGCLVVFTGKPSNCINNFTKKGKEKMTQKKDKQGQSDPGGQSSLGKQGSGEPGEGGQGVRGKGGQEGKGQSGQTETGGGKQDTGSIGKTN